MLRKFADAAASLLMGATCPGCGTPCARLCPACATAMAAPEVREVVVPGCPGVVAAAPYADLWQRVLVAYKERGAWWLDRMLAPALVVAVAEAVARAEGQRGTVGHERGLVLIPMPSQPRSVRERGLDTTATLARCAVRILVAAGVPARVETALSHRRRVVDQSSLDEAGRWANLRGALTARAGGPGIRVVVDDLTTTGASLAEACRALAAAGTPASACAVVAATPRRDGRR